MKDVNVRSTSRNTAECEPIILRQTDQVRLVFLPTLVDNPTATDACVRGQFVYQRKVKTTEWATAGTVPLSSLKAGEGFKLELHSAELLALLRQLGGLYRIYRQHGIPPGETRFVRMEATLARFLALGESDLRNFLESHSTEAATTLLKLLKWLATSPKSTALRLAAMPPEELPKLTALLGLMAVKDALSHWEQNETNTSEEFWQDALSKRSYVLSQVFAYPVVVIRPKAYVGGKQVSNTGGNVVDFLAAAESTDAVVLIEIKTPQTKLLGPEYRSGVFPLSVSLSGAIAQGLRYRQSLMREFNSITAERSKPLTLCEPRCLIVAGNAAKEITTGAMRESFELHRERLQGVAIIT